MLASGFDGTCEPKAAQFSRDKRICDACLATDFSSSPIPGFRRLIFRFIFSLSTLAAFGPSALVLRHYHMQGFSFLLGTAALAAATGAVVVLLYISGTWLYLRIGECSYARRKPDEARREGERFYCLALWAALTKRKAFCKKMLTQAKRMGFADAARLQECGV